jgi:ABC-type Mn2+/Zn2+ transport system ATPase subunit
MPELLRHAKPHHAGQTAIVLERVTVRFDNTVALDDISLRIGRGERVAVVGPNGAGKSTLFNIIAGVLRPTGGTVEIYGSGPGRHICVGYVPQRNRIDWKFPVSVADVVQMGRVGKMGWLRWPGRTDRAAVAAALHRVGMHDLAGRQIGELSGGQQQRVFLARALAQEAEILLMDEPLNGLDAPSQETILRTLDELQAEGITVLVSTHDLNAAAEQFPTVMLLNRRLIALGSPAETLSAANLLAAYGSHMRVVHTAAGEMLLADDCCGDHSPLLPPANSSDPALADPAKQFIAAGIRN